MTTSTATNAKDLQEELRKAPIYRRPTPYAAGGDRNSFNLQSLRVCFDAPKKNNGGWS